MSGPLAGIRIIEVGHMLAGPYGGMLLADLGAEVIKVEPPEGDIARRISPHQIGPHNAYFASLNRGKKSIVLELTEAGDRTEFHALVRASHALLTNLRPGAIRKLGLTYADLAGINPGIVCVALTGYGLEGPFAERPAYDYVIQALTGVMALTGDPDGPPVKTGYSAVDNSAGMMAAIGLLAKIVEGKGGQVDVAMYDVMLSQLNYIAGAWLNASERPGRHGLSAHPYIVPAQLFRTRDSWLMLFITHDDFWKRFAAEAGPPEWLTDPAFATMQGRRLNREKVLAAIQAALVGDDTAGWLRRLTPLGIVVAAVESLEQALDNAHVAARSMIVEMASADGRIRAIGNPIKTGADDAAPGLPPLLGEHGRGRRAPGAA
jgi:crotonobetainyl-CoA:carnitine CoA-transferase CaiB-like acyl-CoA transferase